MKTLFLAKHAPSVAKILEITLVKNHLQNLQSTMLERAVTDMYIIFAVVESRGRSSETFRFLELYFVCYVSNPFRQCSKYGLPYSYQSIDLGNDFQDEEQYYQYQEDIEILSTNILPLGSRHWGKRSK